MFPGYVTMYKDENDFIHLYFFQGIDDNGNQFYRDLDLTQSNTEYTETIYSDNAVEYVFSNKRIIKITCRLIDNKNEQHIIELSL